VPQVLLATHAPNIIHNVLPHVQVKDGFAQNNKKNENDFFLV
jgi:hypothetical protein